LKIKAICSIVIVLLLIAAGNGYCYSGNSFRNQSTAYTLDDDLDLWLSDYSQNMVNPAGLFGFDGYRLYTNLSNLVDKNEGQFSNLSRDNFLLGGSGDLYHGYRFGSIVNCYNNETKNELSTDESEFTDTDGGGVYDDLRRYLSSSTRDSTISRDDFVFGLAGHTDNFDYGFAYQWRRMNTNTETSSSVDTTDTDLVTNLLNQTSHSDNNSFNDLKTGTHTFTFSGIYRYSPDLTFGGLLGVGLTANEDFDEGQSASRLDKSPADADHIDLTYSGDNYKIGKKYSGPKIQFGLTAEIQTTPSIVSDFEITGYTSSCKDKGGTYDRQIFSNSYLTLGTDTTFTTTNGDVNGGDDYSVKGRGITFYHLNTINLTENMIFAIGFSLSTYSSENTETINADSVSVDVYDDGDNEVNDPDDYTRTVTSSYTTRQKTTSSSTLLSFPVGLEFKPIRKLSLRLGARFVYSRYEFVSTDMLLSSTAPNEIIVYGDGSTTESLLDNPYDPYTNNSSTVKGKSSYTDYYYGAGWDVNEYLSLDFMGFANLTDLSNWKLSAVFKFF